MRNFLLSAITYFFVSNGYATDVFTVKKISSNVYAFITPNPTRDMVDGNSTAIITEEGVIVVDTYGNPDIATQMIAELKKITTKPVKYVINTHWHYDHITGNSVFKKEYPGAIFISQSNTRRLMDTIVPETMATEPQASIDLIADYKKKIVSGKKDDSTQLSKYERTTRYPETIRDAEYFIKHVKEYSYVPPSLTFTDTMAILSGTEKVLLFYPGPAHTSGDAMIYIASQQILITGDVVVVPVPYALGAYHDSWIGALKKIEQLNPKVIIPGHGEVQYNLQYVHAVIEMLDSLNVVVETSVKNHLTLQQTYDSIDFSFFEKKFAGDMPDRQWAFENYFLKPGIKSVFNQRTGIPRKKPN